MYETEALMALFGGSLLWIWLIPSVILACVVAWVANERGRDVYAWGVLGFFIGFIALIILVCVPSKK